MEMALTEAPFSIKSLLRIYFCNIFKLIFFDHKKL